MKYVFFGGRDSEFAEIILQKLIKAGLKPVATFRNAKEAFNIEKLKSFNADVFIVASFGKILKKDLLEIPSKGVIGVHPSLLPKYRGPSPIQSVILNDEKETGMALFLVDEKVDNGPILISKKLTIAETDTYNSLTKKLAELGAELLIKSLPLYIGGSLKPTNQNNSEATFTKKFSAKDSFVNLKDSSKKNWLKIKALNPEPGTYTVLKLKDGKEMRLKLLEADFKNNQLELKTVQPEGKKPMSYSSFLNGYKNKISS